jgi:hypothetical protein
MSTGTAYGGCISPAYINGRCGAQRQGLLEQLTSGEFQKIFCLSDRMYLLKPLFISDEYLNKTRVLK